MKKNTDHKVMKNVPLQDIMNRMAQHLDDVCPGLAVRGGAGEDDTLGAAQNLMGRDMLLAQLYKEYMDARAVHQRLMRSHGTHDPMTDVAEDRADSARCAFETRMLELRRRSEEEEGRRLAIKRLRAMREEVEALEESRVESSRKHEEAQRQYADEARLRDKQSQQNDAGLLMLVAMYYALRGTPQRNRALDDFHRAVTRSNEAGAFNQYAVGRAS